MVFGLLALLLLLCYYLYRQRVSLAQQTSRLAAANVTLETASATVQQARIVTEGVLAEYRAFMHAIPDAVFVLDEEGRYITAPGMATLASLPLRDILGSLVHEVLPPQVADLHMTAIRQALATRKRVEIEYRVDLVDCVQWIAATISPVLSDQVLWVGRDITQHKEADEALRMQKQLEDQLRQSQKLEAVGQLAGGIAHDFNNLLTVIRGHSELLAAAIDRADPRHAGIQQIHDASRRAAALTRQLLAFTRKQVLQPRVIAVNQCVTNLESMLRRLIGEDIEVVLQLRDDAGHVMADPGQLDQVLINLAVNARDAMASGGTLSLTTANVELDQPYVDTHEGAVIGSYVLLAVSDTGCGMDRDTCARVFEPFFTTKPLGQGCGLGLSTVYGIVKQSGGYVWVYSEVGHGTNIKIYLPRVSHAAAVRPHASPAVEVRGGTETVLLVEDDDALRSLGRQILARHGYTVLDAANGREALHLANHHEGHLNLIVTDMVMPEMSGRELVTRLLTTRPETHVLSMSGYMDDDIQRRGMLHPGAEFLQKPFTAHDLLRAVRAILDVPAADDSATVLTSESLHPNVQQGWQ